MGEQRSVTVDLPIELVERLNALATLTGRDISALVESGLEHTLPPTDDLSPSDAKELIELTQLDDVALWKAARAKLDDTSQDRLDELLEVHGEQTLNGADLKELESLVARGNDITLRKAQAFLLLARRGYRVPMQAAGWWPPGIRAF
jgi:predicted DNA-binding protein